jgi:predicted house-cleaning NTP pyrophosphatase (Maf/HAM1 superfamily)
MATRLILGSESKWRRRILEKSGLEFECMAAAIDEKAITVSAGGLFGIDEKAVAEHLKQRRRCSKTR